MFSRIALCVTLTAFLACADGGDDAASSGGDGSVTLSGQALAGASDVAQVATTMDRIKARLAKLSPITRAFAAIDTGATANEVLPGAEVELYKVFADGSTPPEEVDIGQVTTDSEGNFEIADISPPTDSDDFYYEVHVTKGDLEILSPTAAQADATVNVSPETDLAAAILSDVVDVLGVDNPPLPPTEIIEATRELVVQNAADLADAGAIEIPSLVGTSADDNLLATANGLASNGGSAEKLFLAAAFESEFEALTEETELTDAQAAGFIKRVIREGCDQGSGDYMPQGVADALGTFFNEGGTVTPAEIVSAYNNNFSGSSVVLADAVAEFAAVLESIEADLAASAATAGTISQEEQIVLLVRHDLESDSFASDTELVADQAGAFIQFLSSQLCDFDNGLDIYGLVAELLADSGLATARISDAQVYHNSGFGCDEGSGEGHFYAEVQVYTAGKTVSSVTISSSDSSALGGDGVETLTEEFVGVYRSNTNGVCVALGTDVDYTVTAAFSDTSEASLNVDRNHPRIPEAASSVFVDGAFIAGSDSGSSPTVVDSTRPLYQWTSPADMLTNIINDASNTGIASDLSASTLQAKYTYEFSHVDTSAAQVSPAGECDQVSSGRLYSVDSFMPTVDCDLSTCATASGIAEEDIQCRMNIQSYLVDENDNILGQAAGHFRFFCVDADTDGSCP